MTGLYLIEFEFILVYSSLISSLSLDRYMMLMSLKIHLMAIKLGKQLLQGLLQSLMNQITERAPGGSCQSDQKYFQVKLCRPSTGF